MKNTSRLFFVILLLAARPLFAFPDQEKATLNVASSQATSFIAQSDRFLFLGFSNNILRLDTETFALSDEQVPILQGDAAAATDPDVGGDVEGLAARGNSLFVSQSDGDLLTIDLNGVTGTPAADHIIDGALGPIAANSSTSSTSTVYLLNPSGNAIIVFDTTAKTSTTIPLVDASLTPVSPEAIAFVPSTSGSTGKVYVTSNRGLIFVLPEGATGLSSTITLPLANEDLPALSPTPDGRFLLVADATNNTVHVIDTSIDAEVDTDTSDASLTPTPIALQNSGLAGIVVTDVHNPDDTYAYVSGASGLSVIDLNIASGTFNHPTVIDLNGTVSGDNPLTLTSSPKALVASSADDGYVYADDSNAAISVITENPFVDITGTSLGSGPLSTSGTFNLTFQTDETGTFRVVVGGDSTTPGTEVASGTVDTALVDVTTPDITFDSSVFSEGTNRVFVFVTDSAGLVGRDAIDIDVNTPPQGIEVLDTNFGDQKIFVTFRRLTASDIASYNIYIDTDSSAVATKTDAAGAESQPTSGDTLKVKIVGLDNGVTYFVGIEAVDTSGNVGTRTTTFPDGSPISATPEATIGLAEAVGENGCELMVGKGSATQGMGWLLFVAAILAMAFKRVKLRHGLFLALFLMIFSSASAAEKTPQWFSLELKGGVWIPTNGTTKDFIGTFSPTGSIEFGFLYHARYGAELGVGFISASGTAVGSVSGNPSGDHFGLLMIPISNSFVFRADFKEDQLFVPYVKAGPDYVYYRETLNGGATSGLKFGLHGAVGLQILLDRIDELSSFMEETMGVNDVFFTIEGRYGWINNFGGNGLDLSNLTATGGFLFEF